MTLPNISNGANLRLSLNTPNTNGIQLQGASRKVSQLCVVSTLLGQMVIIGKDLGADATHIICQALPVIFSL